METTIKLILMHKFIKLCDDTINLTLKLCILNQLDQFQL